MYSYFVLRFEINIGTDALKIDLAVLLGYIVLSHAHKQTIADVPPYTNTYALTHKHTRTYTY